MSGRRILTVVGARPQFVKAAAVSRAIKARGGEITEILVHTGQHFDPGMSQIFFDELGLDPPRFNLDIHSGGHGEMTGRMLAAVERLILDERPDLVLVPGDTTSTLAGALAAAKLHVPVAHLEAGLRSFNRRMPEEVNRVLTDHLSALLLVPDRDRGRQPRPRRDRRRRPRHRRRDVRRDPVRRRRRPPLASAGSPRPRRAPLRAGHRAPRRKHRRPRDAGRDRRLPARAGARASRRFPAPPPHPPTLRRRRGRISSGIILCEPLGYLDMHRLLQSALAVFTDSGGLQKEAYFHRVPCVTLRTETEWVETVEAGWNRLWQGPPYTPRRDIAAYGDGHAAEQAVELIVDYLNSDRP